MRNNGKPRRRRKRRSVTSSTQGVVWAPRPKRTPKEVRDDISASLNAYPEKPDRWHAEKTQHLEHTVYLVRKFAKRERKIGHLQRSGRW